MNGDKLSILFIINPISGTGKKGIIEKLIPIHLSDKFEVQIKYTKYAGHGKELAQQAVQDKINIVVAVGGDGSVNEIGSQLIYTNTVLGIIPAGSGNGFARHLGIPINFTKAIHVLNKINILEVDTGEVNNIPFIGTAGVGLDAHISMAFSNASRRGFWTYFKLTLKYFKHFKERQYNINVDGVVKKVSGIIVCCCNINQWGNNAYIAPKAEVDSGKMEVAILQKVPLINLVGVAFKLFSKRIHQSKLYQSFSGSQIIIFQPDEISHIDGDPVCLGKELNFKVIPKSLKVISV